MAYCRFCMGKGKLICPQCGPTSSWGGALDVYKDWKTKSDAYRAEKCPLCKRGWTDYDRKKIKCPECNGTGKEYEP